MTTSNENKTNMLTKQDLNRAVFHGLGMEWGWTYERQMNLAYFNMVRHALEKIYKDQPEKLHEAMVRNVEFFNITPQLAPFVGGIALAMEEQNAKSDDFDTKSITAIKSALMGPLSGIGDSIFLSGIRIIALGVGIPLCLQGNFLGVILYFLIYNIPAFWLRYAGIYKGYEIGTGYLDKLKSSGLIDKVMQAASIVGIMVIGAMSITMVYTSLTMQIGSGDTAASLQSVLDGILPGMIPLGVTWLYYWLLGKKKINIIWLIIGTIVVGIAGAYFGILG